MQPLLVDARASMEMNDVIYLLTGSPTLQVDYSAEWINTTFGVVQDLADWMGDGSKVSSDITARIHRSCTLAFDTQTEDGTPFPVPYLSDFVRPYVVLTDPTTGLSARFNLGVYTLQTPVYDYSLDTPQLSFTGYDLLTLLDTPVGDTYVVAAGNDPAIAAQSAIQAAVPNAKISGAPSLEVLSSDMVWAYDPSQTQTTYLDVVTDLLNAVGFGGVWVDWNGVFQIGPYVDPSAIGFEWEFDLTDPDNIISEARSSTMDLYDVPNWWRFVQANLTAPPTEGVNQFTFLNLDSTSPTSIPNRGGRQVRRTYSVPATSYAALVNAANIQIDLDQTPSEVFTVASSPFPLAWHRDLILFRDDAIAATPPYYLPRRRVLAVQWELTLDGSSDMTWKWQTVSAV